MFFPRGRYKDCADGKNSVSLMKKGINSAFSDNLNTYSFAFAVEINLC